MLGVQMPDWVWAALQRVCEAGGAPCLVGGAVRDMLMGVDPRDLDFEVYGVTLRTLEKALGGEGRVATVGHAFGVTKLWGPDGTSVDFALPRRERKCGTGHRGFEMEVDPYMLPAEACQRRDYTVNAMMWDVRERRLLDPVGGLADLEARVLRHVGPQFAEDPLRPLRGMQFAARYGMTVDPETAQICADLRGEAGALSSDRVWGEWRKWALAPLPIHGLRALEAMGWLEIYPELGQLRGLVQDARHHAEGDVWEHTQLAVGAAACIAERNGVEGEARVELVLAALLHDIGKADTTRIEADRITAHGHAVRSAEMCGPLAERLGMPHAVRDRVQRLVAEHMVHIGVRTPSKRVVRRLAERLHPVRIADLRLLVQADAWGRKGDRVDPDPLAFFALMAEALGVIEDRPRPILLGRHLLARGVQPGPAMGRVLRAAFEAQMDGAFEDEAGALAWLDARQEG